MGALDASSLLALFAGATLLFAVFLYHLPRIQRCLKGLHSLGEMDKDPNAFFAKNRAVPYFDAPIPFQLLPSQTWLMNYDLVRKFYQSYQTLDYTIIKRSLDIEIWDLRVSCF